MAEPRSFDELRPTGLLWLINVTVFHPRGYALALHFDDDGPNPKVCTGWSLMGDGSESWSMGDPPPEAIAAGAMTPDDCFRAAAALLAPNVAPDVDEPHRCESECRRIAGEWRCDVCGGLCPAKSHPDPSEEDALQREFPEEES
jgi:hypothetical protein